MIAEQQKEDLILVCHRWSWILLESTFGRKDGTPRWKWWICGYRREYSFARRCYCRVHRRAYAGGAPNCGEVFPFASGASKNDSGDNLRRPDLVRLLQVRGRHGGEPREPDQRAVEARRPDQVHLSALLSIPKVVAKMPASGMKSKAKSIVC